MPHASQLTTEIEQIAEAKAALRREALERRAALAEVERAALAETAADHAMQWLGAVAGETVSLFVPIGHEIPTGPLARRLREAGAILALPVVVAPHLPLVFRRWDPGSVLEPSAGPGRFSIPAPAEGAPEVEPDILVVPLAAFDRHGNRLGYGGGFYDRTLARLRRVKRIEAIGYAFAIQRLDDLPAAAHDERLDAVITDTGVILTNEE
ncbi:5-formyltetrahydrofolate cyclo-ligase [Ancylobacter sp. 6x-1]|uniref:5-formyltetrahydrofolate cyclo-ligase n=1 Tax=Ancylobacter crimeensis TaxID=2579147 RepID=A0ABT0DE77_9HYPH|nr:5-formyltetrahydrofolate cyclo-ligase [Ancylobacter crimeensis]MCK0198282.1 5-formyltetrahydrofolate cyclo-ligase [Ancylobacter crimeensis]